MGMRNVPSVPRISCVCPVFAVLTYDDLTYNDLTCKNESPRHISTRTGEAQILF